MAPADDALDEASPSVRGYSDLTLLGFGGFSRVWAATRDRDAHPVALKIASERGSGRFDRETAAMQRIGPPLVPELFETGRLDDGRRFLAMERIEGQLLADWLAQLDEQVPPIRDAARLVTLLCAAVGQMHDAGIIHRDLKPENVMLRSRTQLTILDLGLARAPGESSALEDDESLELTQTGAMLGTVVYMAPEQALGRKDLDERVDIYSLAVMTFELLTGRPPFLGERAAIQQAHAWRKAPQVSDRISAPKALDEVISRGLAKDPDLRFKTTAEYGAAFSNALKDISLDTITVEEPVKRGRSARSLVALLAIPGVIEAAELSRAASTVGGTVVRTTEECYVVAFPSASSPTLGVEAALAVAEDLVERVDRCVVHIAELRVRSGARGVMVIGKAIQQAPVWSAVEGRGVFVTDAAAELLSKSRTDPSEMQGYRRLRVASLLDATDTSVMEPSLSVGTTVRHWGRDDVVAQIMQSARAAFDDSRPSITTIIGESGLGKSHLLRHMLDKTRAWRRVRVVHLRSGGHGDAILVRLLREAFGLFDAQPTLESVKAACVERLEPGLAEQAWPAVASALGVVGDSAMSVASNLVGPTAVRQALARAIGEALREAARTRALALVLDEAHRADFTTLDALELATLAEGAVPLWVCVAATPALLELRSGWAARAASSDIHELGPLEDDAARGLLLQLLFPVEYVPDDVLKRLLELTGAVPLYLTETAAALKQSGAIRQRMGTDSWFVAADALLETSKIPLAERLARAALSGLREDLVGFASLCAIVGGSVTARGLDAIQRHLDPELGYSDLDPVAGLAHLVDRRMLRSLGHGRHEFRQPVVRDALVGLVPTAVRRLLHGAVYRYLDSAGDVPSALLARHAQACGEREVAARLYTEVATDAEARFRYVEAEQAYSAALTNLPEDDAERRQVALTGRGRVHHCVGRHADALIDLRQAIALARTRRDRHGEAELLLEQATILDWQFQFPESADAAHQAQQLASSLDDDLLNLRCELARGRTLCRQEKMEAAREVLSNVNRAAEAIDDNATRVIALAVLGGILVSLNRLAEAEQTLDEMIDVCTRVGDRLHLGVAYCNRLLVWTARHDYERAVADAERAVSVAREIGHFQLERIAHRVPAELLLWIGKLDEALEMARRASDIQQRFVEEPDPDPGLLIARILAAQGDEQEPSELLRWIDDNCDEVSPSQRVLMKMVELSGGGGGSAADWDALLRESEEHSLFDERLEVLFMYARAAKRAGREEDVARAITVAHELTDETSIWRNRFVTLT